MKQQVLCSLSNLQINMSCFILLHLFALTVTAIESKYIRIDFNYI